MSDPNVSMGPVSAADSDSGIDKIISASLDPSEIEEAVERHDQENSEEKVAEVSLVKEASGNEENDAIEVDTGSEENVSNDSSGIPESLEEFTSKPLPATLESPLHLDDQPDGMSLESAPTYEELVSSITPPPPSDPPPVPHTPTDAMSDSRISDRVKNKSIFGNFRHGLKVCLQITFSH